MVRRRIHVITPSRDPARAVSLISGIQDRAVTIIDLSAGEFRTPSGISQNDLPRPAVDGTRFTWIDAVDLAPHVGDTSRRAYVEWLADISNRAIVGNRSIKQLFCYANRISLWWFSASSEKHPVGHPLRWLFFMIFAVRHHFEGIEHDPTRWVIWAGDAPIGHALRHGLPKSADVDVLVEPWDEQALVTELPEPSRGWPSRLFLLRHALALGRAMRREITDHRRRRRRAAHVDGAPDRPFEHDERFEVLIHTLVPHSWTDLENGERFDDAVSSIDRYLGDAPWRIRRSGMSPVWMPVQNGGDPEDSFDLLNRQTLPDVRWALRATGKQLTRVFRSSLAWAVKYCWYFEVRRIHRRWTFRGVPLGEWIRRDYATVCFGAGFRQMLMYERLREAIRITRPDAVLFRDEFYRSGRLLAAAAAGLCPRVAYQHAIIDRENTVYQFAAGELEAESRAGHPDFIEHCPSPDVIAALGDHTVQAFEGWNGFPQDRIFAIGGLRHDSLRAPIRSPSTRDGLLWTETRRRLDLPVDRPVVVLCTGLERSVDYWFDVVTTALKRSSITAHIAVKLHQYHGGQARLEAVSRSNRFTDYSIHTASLIPLIRTASVVLGMTSTTLLEARLIGRPAVALVSSRSFPLYSFDHELGIPSASSADDLSGLLVDIQTAPPDQQVRMSESESASLSEHVNSLDAGACRRVERLLRFAAGLQKYPA